MFQWLKNFFSGNEKAVAEEKPAEAPYKVETPVAKVEEVNAQPIVKPVEAKPAPAKKSGGNRKPKNGETKSKAPQRKPRKPKAPKA